MLEGVWVLLIVIATTAGKSIDHITFETRHECEDRRAEIALAMPLQGLETMCINNTRSSRYSRKQ